jgi:hypothetical protein
MRTSETVATIASAVVAAAADLQPVMKDATNPAFRNKYATLDAIMEQVRPVLAAHGLAVLQGVVHPETENGKVTGLAVETRLLHRSGEWISSMVTLPVEKSTAQGAGSAISYGRRYGLSALLGLTAEDDDGNAASQRPESKPAQARPEVIETRQASKADAAGGRLYQQVPSTPGSISLEAAMKAPFPFKKTPAHHGKPLGDLPLSVLESTAEWCKKTDADKFADLITKLELVIGYLWQLEQEQADANAQEAQDHDLPF